jgi:hypothetical protein
MIAKTNPLTADTIIYDVIIIGAGPSGLATAARLRESHPSALFTDEEQARYSWISRSSSVKNRRTGKVQNPSPQSGKEGKKPLKILVLDASGDAWMNRWKSLFDRLRIEFLRSPMFFHPDPQDRDSLLAYCHTLNNNTSKMESHIQEIAGCVGKEISKHKKKQRVAGSCCARAHKDINERDRQDYFAPSAKAFRRFCEECVDRYELKNLVEKGKVLDIDYVAVDGQTNNSRIFSIRTAERLYHAKSTVLALGAGEPIIPTPFSQDMAGSASHALDISARSDFIPSSLLSKIRNKIHTHAIVIGGGLTSAQVADCLLRKGVSKVYLMMRGPWKVKPFDVDLVWMGKWRNTEKAYFWSEDDLEERLCMAKQARGGGSITPRYTKLLKEWIRQGRLMVHTHTTIVRKQWDAGTGCWTITTQPRTELPPIDHIVFATGLGSDIRSMEMLQNLREAYPIESFGGLPALTDDLMWNEEVPLFMTGKMAMLRLGPGAGNLEGSRVGAERIAWGISKVLDGLQDDDEQQNNGHDEVDRYVQGIGSKFAGLLDEDSGVEF